MRLALVLMLAAVPVFGELLRIGVAFQDAGCASCVESLAGRLARVRGVERVELDAEESLVTLHLTPGNRVRLTPLLARITQDGTKVLRTEVMGRGTIVAAEGGYVFEPAGSAQTYRLRLEEDAAKAIEPDKIYEVRGVVSGTEPGEEPVLAADSITLEISGKK